VNAEIKINIVTKIKTLNNKFLKEDEAAVLT
jgi:hypothetical protein